jgi:hypothetical protein
VVCIGFSGRGGEPEGKKTLGKPRRRWEDSIKMGLQKVGYGVWTGSNWLRIRKGELVKAIMNLQVP